MKKLWLGLLVLLFLGAAPPALAEWTNLSRSLPEPDIRTVAVDPRDPRVIYAGSASRLYRSPDGGASWKRVLGVRGTDNQIHFIYIHPQKTSEVYVATSRGIQKSEDGERHWNAIYRGLGGRLGNVFCIASASWAPERLWAGTEGGLVRLTLAGDKTEIINGLPHAAVYSVWMEEAFPSVITVGTQKGIYKSTDGGTHWERTWVNPETPAADRAETSLEQFQIEEFLTPPFASNIVFWDSQNKFYAATRQGIVEGAESALSWTAMKGQSLPDKKINYLAKSAQTLYAATDKGVVQWQPQTVLPHDLSDGLESKEVRALHYSAAGDFLLAATRKGVFQYRHPELGFTLPVPVKEGVPQTEAILRRFESEPTIRQVQEIAVQYAEVHPAKIQAWRRAAAAKALLPTLSVHTDMGTDENVDIDRGGTADADRFIMGPEERSLDWSVGLSWDLGDVVWNNDQTSIDTRSRLMVELRDDVLNEVTHLYYERRRLQIEMALSPVKDLPVRMDQEIRLQELTAGIDALTGGNFSSRLPETG